MTQQTERRVKFFGPQYDAFNFETQFGAAVAGVQSGKTFLGAHWAGKKIQEFPDKNGAIVAPTYNILQAATLKKFFEIFPELRQYYKEQKGEISLPTGGTVFIRSADNPLGIEGITADWVWLDEGGMCSVLTWTVLRSRVSMTGGQILITTTPYNMGWLYQDFYKPWKEGLDSQLSFSVGLQLLILISTKNFMKRKREGYQRRNSAGAIWGNSRRCLGLSGICPKSRLLSRLRKTSKLN